MVKNQPKSYYTSKNPIFQLSAKLIFLIMSNQANNSKKQIIAVH